MTGDGLGAILSRLAAVSPDHPFIKVGGGEWLSYGVLDERSNRVANGLTSLGISSGDRVAFLCPNRQEVVDLIFACAKIGAMEVPLNCYLRGEFLIHQLSDSAPAVVVTDAEGLRLVSSVVHDNALTLVTLDETTETPESVRPYEALMESDSSPPDVRVDGRDPLSIIYTSGTTGRPKGCVLPHRYFTAHAEEIGRAGWLVSGDRMFSAFPLFHSGGQLLALATPLTNGASICLQTEFHASSFMRDARAEGATVVWGLGVMGSAILAQPPRADDASPGLRLAAWPPMDAARQLEFEARFGVPVRTEIYGQTESQPIGLAPIDRPEHARGSQGAPNPLFEVRVVDEYDDELPPGALGEIVVRPRQPDVMFAGYWRQPAATLSIWRNLWHHTGDLGRIDDGGWIRVAGRKKDVIRRRGENVSAMELESIIGDHPAIARVAVVAVPSPLGEDDIRAVVVLRGAAEVTPADLFAYLQERLPYFAVPRYVDFRDSLPLTATGSVMKEALQAEASASTWDFETMGFSIRSADRRAVRSGAWN